MIVEQIYNTLQDEVDALSAQLAANHALTERLCNTPLNLFCDSCPAEIFTSPAVAESLGWAVYSTWTYCPRCNVAEELEGEI